MTETQTDRPANKKGQSANKQDHPATLTIEQHVQTIYHQSFKDPWAAPMMLPDRDQSFVGRAEDLAWLTQQLTAQPTNPGTTIAICGQSGIGKTALVVEAITRLSTQDAFSKRYPDGVFYYAFNAYLTPAIAYVDLARIFDAFDHARELNPRLAAMQSLKRRRALLVFDGLEALAEEQISELGKLGGANVVLLISRRSQDATHAAAKRAITGLSQEDGVLLLQKLGGEQADTKADVERIVSQMKSIPLALQLVGRHLANHQEKAAAYRQWFERTAGRPAPKKSTKQAPGIMMLLQHTYDTLGPCEQQIFALLGLLAPMPFPIEIVQKLITVSPETLQKALDTLVAVHILRQSAQNYEASHQLVHTFSKDSLSEQIPELPAALIFPAPSWMKNVTRITVPRHKSSQIATNWQTQLIGILQNHFTNCDLLNTPHANLWLPHVLPLIATEYASSPQSLILANLFNSAGFNAMIQEKYALAQRLLKEALTIREQQLGTEHPDTAQSLNDQAELYMKLEKYTAAEPLFKRALAIREKEVTLIYPDTALTLNNLGLLYQAQGKYSEAEPLFKRAFNVCKQLAGAVHADTGNVLNNLALLYNEQGKYSEAEPLLQLALAIREQQLGRIHPTTAQTMHAMGTLYQVLGNDSEPERLFKLALAIREQKLGAEHPDTMISLLTLGDLYRSQEKFPEAEPLFQRALTTREKQLGTSHPAMIQPLNNLATLYYEMQKYTLAEPLFQRSLTICKQQINSIHPELIRTLNYLATLYQDQGKHDVAEPLFQRAIFICKQQVGPKHPDMALQITNLAGLYKDQRKYPEAEALFQRALIIREEQLGADHADTVQSLSNLAALYRTRQKYAEAEPLFQRVLAIREEQLGVEHPDTAVSLNNLAALYKTEEKYTLAEPLFQRALAILEPHLGRSHPTTITVKKNLAALSYLLKEEKATKEKFS